MSVAAKSTTHTPLAIVGVSGRYPKADNLEVLWANLKAGVDGVGEAKGDRWDLGFHSKNSDHNNRVYTKAGGFLDRIDLFDAEFFGLSPREAQQVDPQHRLMLELSWEAMESAGMVPADLAGSRTGVFVGVSNNDYCGLVGQEKVDAYTNIGSALSICANRISYQFDLHGPSMSIDTACSSSMVAMHQACRAIESGECSMALVGGVNILASMKPWIGFAQASMLSPDGRCKSFDADGAGYVRAEGGGVVIVKPLADAERDGDSILAVILGAGVNSDGRTMGMAMPSGEAQEALLRQVYGACGVAPEQVFYVEAHGTGTAVGDPIECGAIGRVLGRAAVGRLDLSDRLGEVQHRTSGVRRRHRGPDQALAGDPAPRNPRQSAFQHPQSEDRFRGLETGGGRSRHPPARPRRTPGFRGQLVWLWRHKRSPGPPGIPAKRTGCGGRGRGGYGARLERSAAPVRPFARGARGCGDGLCESPERRRAWRLAQYPRDGRLEPRPATPIAWWSPPRRPRKPPSD